jgi:hypothetical protein
VRNETEPFFDAIPATLKKRALPIPKHYKSIQAELRYGKFGGEISVLLFEDPRVHELCNSYEAWLDDIAKRMVVEVIAKLGEATLVAQSFKDSVLQLAAGRWSPVASIEGLQARMAKHFKNFCLGRHQNTELWGNHTLWIQYGKNCAQKMKDRILNWWEKEDLLLSAFEELRQVLHQEARQFYPTLQTFLERTIGHETATLPMEINTNLNSS